MKKFISLTILVTVMFFAMSAMPADKASSKNTQSTVSVFIANGTNFYGYCDIGGIKTKLNPTSGITIQQSPGLYTVVLHTDSPGSHQYQFTGKPTQVNSTGTATFTNVSLYANANAAIY